MATIDSVLKIVLPKRQKPMGQAQTNTYSEDRKDQVLSAPAYREHLEDLFNTRQSSDSRELLKKLFIHDPDVSAAVNAFLTVADTDPIIVVKDQNGVYDRQGQKKLNKLIARLTTRYDYSTGFQMTPTLRALCEDMRYMVLLRGGLAEELVFDKTQVPSEIRHVDLSTIEWFEKAPNQFVPQQTAPSSSEKIALDVPTFFVSFFRRDPTSIYTYSPFVSAINTVAARQQVINDLYRIMQQTGFPRIEAKVLEEVLLKNAPMDVKQDQGKQTRYLQSEVARIQSQLASMRSDQAIVHTDSVELSVFNASKPSNTMNIDSIIGALNAMNQAGLRVVSTVLGRGETGVNTASVEARVFSMNAEALNKPIADLLSQMLTMALRVSAKSKSRVEVRFRPVELRPETELESHMTMRAARLRQDLSDGIITDDEYHLEMYGRIRPDNAPELSGTGFMNSGKVEVDAEKVTPNDDALGRSLAPEGAGNARGSDVSGEDGNK